jgi:D-glycero-alpha-D-manno-heptose-7-phosphate kinase
MIISKTPYRISFFGGGTDYPFWFKKNGGIILGSSIDKYCYITIRDLPPFFANKHRIVWSKIETVNKLNKIEHPAIRECLKKFNVKKGIEVHHVGDLPARSGIGSSSSFAVGLISALIEAKKIKINKKELAKQAIHFEQKILKETVGIQDQILATYGGFLEINIKNNSDFNVRPLFKRKENFQVLQKSLTLLFTGISRFSSNITRDQIKNYKNKMNSYNSLHQLALEAKKIFAGKFSIEEIGLLLNESWKIKKNLSDKISNHFIDDIHDIAKSCGAYGGKVLGAGGGGFVLFLTNKNSKMKLKKRLKNFLEVPVKFENDGSKIIFNSRNEYI